MVCRPLDHHNLQLKDISPDTISLRWIFRSHFLCTCRPRQTPRSMVLANDLVSLSHWYQLLNIVLRGRWLSHSELPALFTAFPSRNPWTTCCRFRRSLFVYQHIGPDFFNTEGLRTRTLSCPLFFMLRWRCYGLFLRRHHVSVCLSRATKFVWNWPMGLTWKSLWACSRSCQFEVTCDYFASGARLVLAAFVPCRFLLTVKTY